jgi:hypothetical protein
MAEAKAEEEGSDGGAMVQQSTIQQSRRLLLFSMLQPIEL